MELEPLYVDGLSPAVKERAIKELGETPENVEKALLEVRRLINESPDFYFYEDDTFLMKFLRVKKFNALRTFNTVKNYYTFKKQFPGILTDFILNILKGDSITLSPLRTPDGSAVLHIHLGPMDFDKFTPEQYFQSVMVLGEQAIETEATQVTGGHLVLDFKGITLKKIKQLSNPSFLAMIVKGIENTWPIRMASAQIVNEPFYVSVPFNILFALMSKKLKSRINFNGSNLSNLHKTIPVECLPTKLGGKLKPEALRAMTDIAIAKQMETERTNKYSYHRVHRIVKKLSTCGLEEQLAATNLIQSTSQPIPNVAI